jgi:SAM-dependent methyltransferase
LAQTNSSACAIKLSENNDIPIDWYKEYFGEDYWDLVHYSCSSFEHTEVELKFLENLFEENSITKVLDLCCGIGRHVIPLSAKNYEVTGIEINPVAVESIKKGLTELSLNASVICNDVRDIKYTEEFDCAIFMQTSFGYFSDQENLELLKKVYLSLKPGGLIVLDIPNRDSMLKHFSLRDWTQINDKHYILAHQFDYLLSRRNTTLTVIEDDDRREYHHSIRMYTTKEICDLLTETNFYDIRVLGDFDDEQTRYNHNYRRLQVVGKKL